MTLGDNPSGLTIIEMEDDVESSHDPHLKHITEFNLPLFRVTIRGSTNGMLLLLDYAVRATVLYVCNPISREYIELHCTEELLCSRVDTHGFGTSKIGGHHKVICIGDDSGCHVYTLGTGSWRCIEPPSASFSYESCRSDTFVNGNLHWLVSESDDNEQVWISCFDLDTECFSTFSVPPLLVGAELTTLRDCVCLCDSLKDGIVIWLMKEYGDETSWTKEYVIKVNDYYSLCNTHWPIKVFKDGDIFMLSNDEFIYYSNEKKTIQEIGGFHDYDILSSMTLTPSFLSLKSLETENVISF